MKPHASEHPKTSGQPSAHKVIHFRRAAAKPEAHRYERRKVREFLRHNADSEEASLRFEQFG
jgi:hypothetical protein